MFCSRSGAVVCGNFYASLVVFKFATSMLGVLVWMLKPFPFSSSNRFTIPITSLRTVDSAMYSSSVVLSANQYCILLAHIIGQPSYIITYPVRGWLDN